jgi:hypothetical protein
VLKLNFCNLKKNLSSLGLCRPRRPYYSPRPLVTSLFLCTRDLPRILSLLLFPGKIMNIFLVSPFLPWVWHHILMILSLRVLDAPCLLVTGYKWQFSPSDHLTPSKIVLIESKEVRLNQEMDWTWWQSESSCCCRESKRSWPFLIQLRYVTSLFSSFHITFLPFFPSFVFSAKRTRLIRILGTNYNLNTMYSTRSAFLTWLSQHAQSGRWSSFGKWVWFTE